MAPISAWAVGSLVATTWLWAPDEHVVAAHDHGAERAAVAGLDALQSDLEGQQQELLARLHQPSRALREDLLALGEPVGAPQLRLALAAQLVGRRRRQGGHGRRAAVVVDGDHGQVGACWCG